MMANIWLGWGNIVRNSAFRRWGANMHGVFLAGLCSALMLLSACSSIRLQADFDEPVPPHGGFQAVSTDSNILVGVTRNERYGGNWLAIDALRPFDNRRNPSAQLLAASDAMINPQMPKSGLAQFTMYGSGTVDLIVVSNDFRTIGGVRFDSVPDCILGNRHIQGIRVYSIQPGRTRLQYTPIGCIARSRQVQISYTADPTTTPIPTLSDPHPTPTPTFSLTVSNGGGSASFHFPYTSTPIQQMLLSAGLARNSDGAVAFVDSLYMFERNPGN
jgi:hypothetical protein